MSVFTAYVGLVLRWCSASEGVIQYQSDGRGNANLENTIGFFTSALCLRVALAEHDSFVDLTHHVIAEYCQAYERADGSFLAAQVSPPEFTRNPVFNWIPQGFKMDPYGLDSASDELTCRPVPFENPVVKKLKLDQDPMVVLYDTGDAIDGGVYFPRNRFSMGTMEAFGRNFLNLLDVLVTRPQHRVRDVPIL